MTINFQQLTAVIWIIFMVYWLVSSFSAKKSVRSGMWGRGVMIRTLIAVAVILLFRNQFKTWSLHYQDFITTNPIIAAFGTLLVAIGVAFAIWARVHLGRNWGMPMTKRIEPELVTSGPYAYVRHPIYTGSFIAIVGMVLVDGVLWSILLVIVTAYFIYSAFAEERFLMKTFPSQYPQYKKKTKMLIPFIF